MLAGLGIAVALALAGYGVWTRSAALTDLQRATDDDAIPRVQATTPRPGPRHRTVTLPGNVAAWNEAPGTRRRSTPRSAATSGSGTRITARR